MGMCFLPPQESWRKPCSLRQEQHSDTKEWCSRFIPAVGDSVIGIITERYGDSWSVDIRGPFNASLDALGFEGVTRRNRPNLVAGDLIYARVKDAPRDADPSIICTDADGKVGSAVDVSQHSFYSDSY